MSIAIKSESLAFERVADLLGGRRVLGHLPNSALDAHDLLVQGLPNRALGFLISNLISLDAASHLENAVGMSLRTYQRRKEAPTALLSQEQSGRTWKFAEILAKAMEVLGSQEEAEQWLEQPAIGLDRRRPIDLLATPAGVELVEDHLTRLEYGVYA
ncbi:MAG: DUF2384 domain-containing protein [Caulobacter sp.]|nr:DUF2384 domain-containing protein [Caulobacter sp.]